VEIVFIIYEVPKFMPFFIDYFHNDVAKFMPFYFLYSGAKFPKVLLA